MKFNALEGEKKKKSSAVGDDQNENDSAAVECRRGEAVGREQGKLS